MQEKSNIERRMGAKEKAKELVDKFLPYSYYHEMDNSMNRNYQQEDNAKQCALICVEEILWFMEDADPQALSYELIGYRDFYREVLTEIDNL